MANHFVYEDAPNAVELFQGDVLDRTADLLAILALYHPHYAQQPDYKYFIVMTQSCDLARRGGDPARSPYVNIAAARPVEQVLRREAAKYQDAWQVPTAVIGGGRTKNVLSMFVQRLIDSNEPGYFYLHEDHSLRIHQSCCAILALSVALKAQHYDVLLDAKLAQLKEPFQAKLGSLVGNMYSRVGTTEWDREISEPKCREYAEKLLTDTFVIVPEEQIKEGLADLKDKKELDGKQPDEVLAFIQSTKTKPRSRKLLERATEVITENKKLRLFNQIYGRVSASIRSDSILKQNITQALAGSGVEDGARLADELIWLLDERIKDVLSDDKLPDRDELLKGLIRGILQDAKIAKILQ